MDARALKESRKKALNKEWHEKNRMPKNATMKQRAQWHKEHIKNCGCRPMPKKIEEFLKSEKSKREKV